MARGGGLLRVPRSVEAPCRVLTCGLTPLQRARLLDASRGSAAVADAKSPDDLTTALQGYSPGQRVAVTWTDGSRQSSTATVTLGAGPAD